MTKDGLTTRQQQILDLVRNFSADHGYPPTVRELCKLAGIGAPGIVRRVEARLDGGRQQPEHDRGERHEQADRELHELDRVARPMSLGQTGIHEETHGGARAQQDQDKERRPEVAHVLSIHAVSAIVNA